MKNNNNNTPVFVLLGVILLIIVGAGVYMSTTNPDSVQSLEKDIVTSSSTMQTETDADTTSGEVVSGGFELSPAQVDALVTFGIDSSDVPTTITAEQETCFVAALGGERVAEIKGGDVPNSVEFFKAKSCI